MKKSNEITVIVSVLNGGNTIENCIKSIIEQDFLNWELIVIDGGSTDNTLDILNSYRDSITYMISEKDNGIYDAWNKGLKKANGEWLCFIGSDDVFLPSSLKNMSIIANSIDVNFICSRVMMVDENGNNVGAIGKKWDYSNFNKGLGIVHCGALHNKTLFENNIFDESYKIAGDFEFLLRVGDSIKPFFLNQITVKMCNKGVSRSSVNKVILETSRAIYYSKNFNKLSGIQYFLHAHISNIFRTIVFLFPFGNKLFTLKNS